MIARQVMLAHVDEIRTAALQSVQDVFDNAEDVEKRIKRSIEESQLLLLKVNFEFYVHRTLSLFWEHFAEHVVRLAYEKGAEHVKEIDELDIPKTTWLAVAFDLDLNSLRDARDVVPVHGLDKLSNCCLRLYGHSLQRLAQQANRVPEMTETIDPWSQLSCCFAIRHLLEHQKGRVDARFKKTSKRWRKTSWSDRLDDWLSHVAAGERPRVSVCEQDLVQTFHVMQTTSDSLFAALVQASVDMLTSGGQRRCR